VEHAGVSDLRKLAGAARDGDVWSIAHWNQGAVTIDHYLALLDDLDLAKTQRALDDIRIEKAHAAVQRAESERDRYRAALDEIAAIPGYTGVTEHARGIAMDALGES
jgi:hypothetical protein